MSKLKWARWQSVEQAGELLFSHSGFHANSVFNIAEAAVSPFFLIELKRAIFQSTFERHLDYIKPLIHLAPESEEKYVR